MGARPGPTERSVGRVGAGGKAALGVKRTSSSVVEKKGGAQQRKFLGLAGKGKGPKQVVATFSAGVPASDAGSYFSPVKGGNLQTLDMLAALTATPVRAKLDQEDGGLPGALLGSPSKDAVMSPLSFPSRCKRRRTAAAMAATAYANQQQPIGLVLPNAVWASGQLGMGGFQPQSAALFPALTPAMVGTPVEASQPQQVLEPPSVPSIAQTLSALPEVVGEQEEGSTKWLDLLMADIKGRLAALKRSKGRIAKVQERNTNELLCDVQVRIEEELKSLQTWLKQVKEMKAQGSTQALLSTAFKLSHNTTLFA
ncbi:hypothetical protein HOP50_04g31830 [Chloropicon primus]|nr:hypothetical protein HOP50_04g31830 [Chloropicon primus]